MAGWVYIISNKAMPGILKIGYTERTPYIRAYELYNTGCPYPYKVDYSVYVNKPFEVEQKAHELQRSTNVGKEWFSCSQEKAIETIANAIKICGSAIENKVQPKPTQSELDGVIKTNTAAASVIEKDPINKPEPKYDPNLSIIQGNVIFKFDNVYYKNNYEKNLVELNSKYQNKINEYKGIYNSVIDGKNKESFRLIFFSSALFCVSPYMLFAALLRDFLGWGQLKFESHWDSFFIGYLILTVILAFCYKYKENQKQRKFKNSCFEDIYRKEIENLNREKEKSISLTIKFYSKYFKTIKID